MYRGTPAYLFSSLHFFSTLHFTQTTFQLSQYNTWANFSTAPEGQAESVTSFPHNLQRLHLRANSHADWPEPSQGEPISRHSQALQLDRIWLLTPEDTQEEQGENRADQEEKKTPQALPGV